MLVKNQGGPAFKSPHSPVGQFAISLPKLPHRIVWGLKKGGRQTTHAFLGSLEDGKIGGGICLSLSFLGETDCCCLDDRVMKGAGSSCQSTFLLEMSFL